MQLSSVYITTLAAVISGVATHRSLALDEPFRNLNTRRSLRPEGIPDSPGHDKEGKNPFNEVLEKLDALSTQVTQVANDQLEVLQNLDAITDQVDILGNQCLEKLDELEEKLGALEKLDNDLTELRIDIIGIGDDDLNIHQHLELIGSGNQCERPRVVFVTKDTYFPGSDFTSLDGADDICTDLASAVGPYGLPGTRNQSGEIFPKSYKAWLSDSNTWPAARFTFDGSFVRTDGVLVANNWADLTQSNAGDHYLQHAIDRDQFGDERIAEHILTSTNEEGKQARDWEGVFFSCDGWTSTGAPIPPVLPENYAIGGRNNDLIKDEQVISEEWTIYTTLPCAYSYPLYCFQQ